MKTVYETLQETADEIKAGHFLTSADRYQTTDSS